MKILFLTHYFPPEVNAPATRTYEHCVRWAKAGHEVTVLTCVPNCPTGVVYEGYRNRLWPQVEDVDGIRVVRVWTFLAANAGMFRRVLNFVSYLIFAVCAAIRLPRPDIVVATSPQFFCGWAGVFVARLKRVPLVLEIRDIWPESIATVGATRNRSLMRLLEWLERSMYLSAEKIVAVGNGYRQKILEKVCPRRPIDVVTNGVDLAFFRPRPPDDRLLDTWGLQDKFVCSYIGTIGMAHGLRVVLEAAKILKQESRDDIRFLLVGDGAEREQLQQAVERDGLGDRVVFTGRLPKDDMPAILASSNTCLIHLRGCELFGTVLPSKIFETMAMQRPIIMGVRGEALDVVRQSGAGIEMEPDSASSLVSAVTQLADHPTRAEEQCRNGRSFVARNYNRDVLAEDFLRILAEIAGVA